MARLRGTLQTTALAIASILITLAAFEAALRLFWDEYYLKFREDLPTGAIGFHPVRGWSLVPGIQVKEGEPEFVVTVTHNLRGLRGPEVPERSTEGRSRLMFLGDSMTYGHGVEDDETFSAVLQRLVPEIEVVNGGVPAYSGVQELLLLEDEGRALEPDRVVVAFFWNDVFDAYESRYARFELERGELRFVRPDPVSPEHPAFAGRNRRNRRTAEHYRRPYTATYTYRFLSDRLKLLRLMLQDTWRRDESPTEAETAEREAAWSLSFALLRRMREVSNEMGARFALMVVPDQAEVEPSIRTVAMSPVLREARSRVEAFAREQGIPYLRLLPGLRALRERANAPFFYRYDGHWNARGHAAAATVLAQELPRLGLIPTPPGAASARDAEGGHGYTGRPVQPPDPERSL